MSGWKALVIVMIVPLGRLAGQTAIQPGTRIASVGFDGFCSDGFVYKGWYDEWVPHDPMFRVSVAASDLVAVGAELDLMRCFPARSSPFTNSPAFSIGPCVTCFIPVARQSGDLYFGTSPGFAYFFGRQTGLRLRTFAGGTLNIRPWLQPGLEIGYCFNLIRYHEYYHPAPQYRTDHQLALGLRFGGRS